MFPVHLQHCLRSAHDWSRTPQEIAKFEAGGVFADNVTPPLLWYKFLMSLSATVKSIQDIMRQDAGVDGDAQRISQLGWMFFLKIFDDQEQELELMRDDYRSPLPEGLRWRDWAANPEGITGEALLKFVNNDLFEKLKGLSAADVKANPRAFVVREVFVDAYNYMKSGTLLRQVVNKINEIDFNSSKDRHLFGDIYEQILRDLQSAGNAGEYYTPRAVTQFMVEMTDPKLGQKVLDPACGTGGFLTGAIEHIRSNYVRTPADEVHLQEQINGVEKKPLPHLLCMTNMLLHGLRCRRTSATTTLWRARCATMAPPRRWT